MNARKSVASVGLKSPELGMTMQRKEYLATL
jgi:hypothetical protein